MSRYLSFSTGDSGYYQKVWKSIVEISSIIYLSANINVNQFLPSTITIFIPTTILNWNICQARVLTLVFCKPRFILEKLLFVHVSLCVHSPIECNGHCLKNGTLKHFLDNICPRSKIWVYRNCPPIGVTQTQTPFYVIKIDFSRISFA